MKLAAAFGYEVGLSVFGAGIAALCMETGTRSWKGILTNEIMTGFAGAFLVLAVLSIGGALILYSKSEGTTKFNVEIVISGVLAAIGVLGAVACGITGLVIAYGQTVIDMERTVFGGLISAITGASSNEEIIKVITSELQVANSGFYPTLITWEVVIMPAICIAAMIVGLILYKISDDELER